MPPAKKKRVPADDVKRLGEWVKYRSFGIDPAMPDPGRVTVRRLNRVEYRNTIRDLLAVDFKADEEFPSDDSGHGFDNIADVLTVSPILLEKYVDAATQIVSEAVPQTSRVMPEQVVLGKEFAKVLVPAEESAKGQAAEAATDKPAAPIVIAPSNATAVVAPAKPASGAGPASDAKRGPKPDDNLLTMSYYESATASATAKVKQAGSYVLAVDMTIRGRAVENNFDNNRVEFVFSADGKELLRKEYGWDEKKDMHFELPAKFDAGDHQLTLDVKRLT